MSDTPRIPTFEPEVVAAATRRRGGDGDKVATTSLKEMVVDGVRLTSRYGKADEYAAMAAMVGSLPPHLAQETVSIFCDSKRGGDFTVELREWCEPTAQRIGACMERACLATRGSFTGIMVRCGGHDIEIEPPAPDDEEVE